MIRLSRAALTAAGVLALTTSPSYAVLQFAADINGTPFSCVDQAGCDTNTTVGILQTGVSNLGGVLVLGSSQTQVIGGNNALNTSSFQLTNTSGAPVTITLAVGGTDFVGPVSILSQSGSGTFQNAIGSNITLSFYADGSNTQGANTPLDLPGTQQANSGLISATLLTDSFSFNSTSAFADANLYSMTVGTTLTLVPGGSLVGRSQAQIAINEVPEPGSFGILGAGLAGFGYVMYRRRRRDTEVYA